jgi:hypothetical protein
MAMFERSKTTEMLINYLKSHDKETRIGYDELTRLTDLRVTARTTNLITARKVLEREHAQVWVCIAPGLGVYRLTDAEIVERQRRWFLAGARNKLEAGAKQAEAVELDALDLQQQARFASGSIIREIAREALARATLRRVEKVSRGSGNDLPAFNAVEWMISLSPRHPIAK